MSALTIIANSSEAIQTRPRTPSLDCFALLAMTADIS